MTKSMFEIIKRQNGEKFAKAIRNFDSGIFEIERLFDILKYAGKNIVPDYEVLSFLASLKPQERIEEKDFSKAEDLFQLAQKAGYKVIYADTLEKQNSIQHFFEPAEKLCTFRDYNRYQNYHILHFVKEGAEELKRSDFYKKEQREDAYATSVLSIQISKTGGFLKICNRYNHTVQNPDNTFNANPDNIIKGLTLSIEKFLGQKINGKELDIPNGYVFLKNRLYKYHLEKDNVFFGSDFYIKDDTVFFINKDYQMIVDTFLIDFKQNTIKFLNDESGPDRKVFYFHSGYNHIPLIKEEIAQGGRLKRIKENDLDVVCLDERPILKSRNGMMVYLHLTKPQKSEESLFCYHDGIEEIYLDNLKEIGDKNAITLSFYSCPNLKVLSLPKLNRIGRESITHLPLLKQLDLKGVQKIESGCLNYLGYVSNLELPNCKVVGPSSLSRNKFLRLLCLKKVRVLKGQAITYNPLLTQVNLPLNLKELHETALMHNPFLSRDDLIKKRVTQQRRSICLKRKGERSYE